MEDAAEALKMAFAVFAFIMAAGIAIVMFNQSKEVADIVINSNDRTYLEAYTESDINNTDHGRIVGVETVVPTLYRYYKEKYSVAMLEKDGTKLNALFDLETERKHYNRTENFEDSDSYTKTQNGYSFSETYRNLYPSGISWIGPKTNVDAKLRVDNYVSNGEDDASKVINGYEIDQRTNFNFDDTYIQTFVDNYMGIKASSVPFNSDEYDGTYFIVESGEIKINMLFEKQ